MTADPIRLISGLNQYRYVVCNPVSFVDPMGLLPNLPKPDGQVSFYSVQNRERTEQRLLGGEPWPNKPTESHFGEGVYTWGKL
ncbi:hypothetical protein SOASR029_30430 [Budvicia aquatica]|nr:hypothetical protein SOASR029_30430 [Budvicia aquatica]